MNWSFKQRLTKLLFISSFITLIFAGLVLDSLPSLNNRILFLSFHIAGIIGVCLATYTVIKRLEHSWLRAVFTVAVFMIWRISYFPIMVIAGYFAGLGESVANYFSLYQLYPIFLLAIAILNYFTITITGAVFFVIFYRYSRQQNLKSIKHGVLASISLPLAALAIAVSFSHPSDWHTLPDTSYIDNKPLPAPALPEMNPYWAALDEDDLPWQQRILFGAAAITYDKVPKNTRWSQIVKGTLEKEFISTNQISTAFVQKYITGHL